MTLDQIETFLKVADKGSFKAASEVLNRSQPALSIAVKKLEEELGIKLFDRDQYRPILTSNGRAFYRKCKELYSQAQALEKYGHQLGMGEEAEITLAIDSLTPLPYVTKVLAHFQNEHPDTRLNLSFEVLGGAGEKVLSGKAQFGISPQLPQFQNSFHWDCVGMVKMVPVISKKIGFLKGEDLTNKDLKNIPQIIVRDSSANPFPSSHGILDGARQWSVQDMATKKEIILAGLGWGRLPEHTISEELAKSELLEINLGSMKRESIQVCLMSSEKHPMGPLSQKLWSLFKDQSL